MKDGRGKARVYDWLYEPKTHHFVRTGDGVLTPFDTRPGCRRR
jgi:hypothetical protein